MSAGPLLLRGGARGGRGLAHTRMEWAPQVRPPSRRAAKDSPISNVSHSRIPRPRPAQQYEYRAPVMAVRGGVNPRRFSAPSARLHRDWPPAERSRGGARAVRCGARGGGRVSPAAARWRLHPQSSGHKKSCEGPKVGQGGGGEGGLAACACGCVRRAARVACAAQRNLQETTFIIRPQRAIAHTALPKSVFHHRIPGRRRRRRHGGVGAFCLPVVSALLLWLRRRDGRAGQGAGAEQGGAGAGAEQGGAARHVDRIARLLVRAGRVSQGGRGQGERTARGQLVSRGAGGALKVDRARSRAALPVSGRT